MCQFDDEIGTGPASTSFEDDLILAVDHYAIAGKLGDDIVLVDMRVTTSLFGEVVEIDMLVLSGAARFVDGPDVVDIQTLDGAYGFPSSV